MPDEQYTGDGGLGFDYEDSVPPVAPPPATFGYMYGSSRYANEPPVPRPTQAQLQALPANTLTDIPTGGWAYRETVPHHERLMQLDLEAQKAQQAAQFAAQDAQMFAQMSRVAHSMKDIEVARREVNFGIAQRRIANGEAPHQVFASMPGLFGSGAGYAAAVNATRPVAPPRWVPPSNGAPGYFQTDKGITVPPNSLGTSTQQDVAAAQKLRQEAEGLRASGNTQGYQDKIRQAELLETHTAPKGVVSQMGYDDQGRPIMTTSVGGTGATVGTQTMSQQKQIGYEMATEGINDILQRLRPSDVGVAGVAGENIFDRWLGQVNPNMVSGERVTNRRALGALREVLYQALSPERISGSGFSNKDAERIKSVADTLEAKHSYPEVVSSLNEIRNIISDRSRVFAERTGQPVPDFAKTPQMIQQDYVNRLNAIKKAVDNHTMTRDQAATEENALLERTVGSLKRFHGINATFK